MPQVEISFWELASEQPAPRNNVIPCGDHVFQTHDYRHSVATALYERGASIQAIREFLGHKHENMTRRYIDCIQKHVDMSSEQYYKEQKSLVSEWRGSDKDGN